MKKLVKKIVQLFARIILLPGLYILSPIVIIKLGIIYNQRIGHLALNTEFALRRLRQNPLKKRILHISACHDAANPALAEMYSRHTFIIFSKTMTRVFYMIKDVIEETPFYEKYPWSDEDQNAETFELFDRTDPILSFTPEEEKRGEELLESMGIAKDDWYVGMHARDSNYFMQWRPELASHWATTEFRSVDIMSYASASERIAEHGGKSIRVGALVEKPLPATLRKNIIDYSSDYRTDFGDIYLTAKCRFLLCCNSGLNLIPFIFNKPIAMTNSVPLNAYPFHSYDLFIPVLFRSVSTGEFVNFGELKKMGLFLRGGSLEYQNLIKNQGIELIPNSPEDIDDLCADMLEKTSNIEVPADIKHLQTEYQRQFHDYFDVSAPIGQISPRFVKKYERLIFGLNG